VPFTLSHAAAALPFRRARLVFSALVIGSFAPDLEYFIRLAPGGGWGHTLTGALAMDLPLGLGAVWIFHRLVKLPFAYLLPDSVRARLTDELVPFRFGPLRRFLLIVFSLLIGIATHLVWDGFTHPQYWIVRHWELLNQVHHYPVLGWQSTCGLLQSISSVGGLALLAVWCVYWHRSTAPDPAIAPNPFTTAERKAVVVIGCVAAGLGSLVRAWLNVGVPTTEIQYGEFISQVVVTFGALIWWQLAMWGLFGPFRRRPVTPSEQPAYAQPQSFTQR
jgi:hypothetical protein